MQRILSDLVAVERKLTYLISSEEFPEAIRGHFNPILADVLSAENRVRILMMREDKE